MEQSRRKDDRLLSPPESHSHCIEVALGKGVTMRVYCFFGDILVYSFMALVFILMLPLEVNLKDRSSGKRMK